jgi:iron complex outermembrane receptor protein
VSDDELETPDPAFDFGTPARTDEMWSAFAQFQLMLVPEKVEFTLGSKLEDHAYTDPELQPTARLLWHALDDHTVWTAVSRAVRSPSRSEIEGSYGFGTFFNPGSPVTLLQTTGNPDLKSEELIAWELGYRFVPERGFSLDITGFLSQYENLRGIEIQSLDIFTSPAPGYVITNAKMDSGGAVTAWGGELSARWQPRERLRLSGFYAFFDSKAGEDDPEDVEGDTRYYKHGVFLRSELDIAQDWILDAGFHYHSPLVGDDVSGVERLDMALRWQLRSDVELSIVGQSLLHKNQTEFESPGWEIGTQVERTVFAMVRWGR